MSILASLARAYERLPDAPPFGYSVQNIGVIVGLNEDGTVASVTPWFDGEGKKRKPRPMLVPQPVKRTAGIAPNFLWDKTSYVLGVTSGEGKRTADEHAAFKERHEKELAGTDDPGLKALLLFLRRWTPDQFDASQWSDDFKDQNVVFALETDRHNNLWLHNRDAAKALWMRVSGGDGKNPQICLVTGKSGPVARVHPAIKGVWGGQSSGGSIVSFNLDAFTSYGHMQGDNAPVSEAAAFAYTTALNTFLSDKKHRLQIGDASTVFWADAEDAEAALLAEAAFPEFFDPAKEDADTTKEVKILLERLRKGDQELDKDLALEAGELVKKLEKGVRFYVLGLAPNAARISIRFYYESDFGELARNYQRFVNDMRIEPPWREPYAPLWRYLVETAVLGKRENVPPNLAGEWMRAILNGADYPLTLLSTVLSRIRADGEINALRASILKAVLIRNYERKVPVALDPTMTDSKGYLLGRLFAVYEEIQRAALGGNVNATIKDKFYGSASATPRKVFGLLESGSANHLAKVRKLSPGRAVNLLKLQDQIMDLMEPSKGPYPAFFSADEQAFFGLGYHHQHSDFFKSRKDNQTDASGETAQ
ncbi:type I-C CRISPR-associated protein Cas8c/Csd1 [Mesorhizobium koreense]|uniref:type I-C CRISPR-associated protein Cas8c/Csd1 n=1 Tax=Mesorhizobium koreense TaxID=3074855 RepID=UPI00287B63CD|nr:type I-C CRISPR-associated protein Cas8c/Csd1 [Mesorhizobium sp. WR6]